MKYEDEVINGCCGVPRKCAFTTASGRCKAREDYEQELEKERKPRKRQSIHDRIAANTSPELLREATEEALKEAEREMQRRDRDPGRTFEF